MSTEDVRLEKEQAERERDEAYADAQNADAIAANVWREEYDKIKKRAEAAEARVRELEKPLRRIARWLLIDGQEDQAHKLRDIARDALEKR